MLIFADILTSFLFIGLILTATRIPSPSSLSAFTFFAVVIVFLERHGNVLEAFLRRGEARRGLGEKWVLVLRAIRRSKREATVDWWAYTAKRCTSTPKYILANVEISTLEWRG